MAAPRRARIRGGPAPAVPEPETPAPPPASTPVVPIREPVREPDRGDAAAEELDRFLTEYSGNDGYRVRLFRLTDRGKRQYLTSMDFDEELLEDVKRRFGGGEYVGRVVNTDNAYIAGGTFKFEIAGGPPAPVESAVTTGTAAGPITGELAPRPRREDIIDAGIMQIFSAMQDQQKITAAMIERMTQPQKSIDLVAVLGVVTPIVLELIKGARTKALTAEEIAAALEGKLGRGGSMKETLGVLREMMEIRELAGGDGGGGGDVVRDAVKLLGPVLARAFTPGDAGEVQPPALPAPALLPSGSEAMPERLWVTRLRPHVQQLARVASGGGDPRGLATSIIQFFMPEQDKGLLRELVADENAQAEITAAFPMLAPFPEWLADFLDEARIEFGLTAPGDEETV